MRFYTYEKKKMPHMSDKAIFMQYKYPISTNPRLASDWRRSWMWGRPPPPPPPDSLKSACMTLLEVGGEVGCQR